MRVEFAYPARLWLIPACAAVIFAIAWLQRSRSRKERVSHILRYVLIVLTVLAISGMSLMTASPDRAAWLVVDVSASMPEEEALALARQALEASGDRKTGVIVFGQNAAVEKSLNSGTSGIGDVHSIIRRDGSDLAEALDLAAALLPESMNGGIAVISDGKVTGAEEWLKTGRKIPVNTLRMEQESGADAQVTDVSVPANLYTGQKYKTQVTVHSNTAGRATLLLTEGNGEAEPHYVTLRKGENVFSFESEAKAGGVVACEARIILPGDTEGANDTGGAYATVAGEISVLVVEGQDGAGNELKKMLESAGMHVDKILPGALDTEASALWAYHAIALVNVDADALAETQIEALDRAVRDLGCGLAVFGGDSSYALGNYRGSALEKILPVNIDVRNRMDLPTTALVLAIDKSGSMMGDTRGITPIEMAREAACSALEVLNERDTAGVIAFEDSAKWVVPMSNVTDVAGMQAKIRTITADGGTAFYSAMMMAYKALKNTDAQYKHLIFLSDGEAGDTGYVEVAEQMAAEGITVTTVAVGTGADRKTLSKIAEAGRGRMYVAGMSTDLPKIFTRETMLISGAYVQNRTFTPAVTDPSMTDFAGFPVLTGYLATTQKPLATVSLCSDRQDPILAWWQYGAGRVAAWTSDIQGGWSASFLNWDGAAEFFGGIVSFILPQHENAGEAVLSDGKLRFTANAGEEILEKAVRAEAQVYPPGRENAAPVTVTLEQVSADTFEGAADMSEAGAYAMKIMLYDREGNELLAADCGAAVPWTREYDLRNTEDGILQKLSSETGGRAVENPEALTDFPDTAARKRRDLTPWLMLLAGLVFLFDIAQRRLDLLKEKDKKKDAAGPAAPEAAPKREKKAKKPEPDQPQAAEVLWQSLQKKKRL